MTEATAPRDRYRILRPIGSGGMSQVFEAFDESLKRTVALKVLHPHLAADPEARARFAREAQATARLRHPNIVEIFDVAGLDAEDAFIVTELIRGPTLRAFAESHRFAPPSELALVAMHQLACALAHAHANGVVHRDLKPENVMLTESGVLKLMDFGIARLLDTELRMTMTGALVGSPLHMAPEIIEGQRATPASDVFSAGTLLYWLLCGVPPFLGNSASQTLKKILDGERPDPRLRAPSLSERQCAFLDRCLDRDPGRRFADGSALRSAVECLLQEEGIGDPAACLCSFFSQPEAARVALTDELVARWTAQAEAVLAQTPPNVARAIERLDRALCAAPQDAAALALHCRVRHLRQAAKRRAWQRHLGLAGALLLGLIAVIAWLLSRAPPELDARAVAQTAPFSPPPSQDMAAPTSQWPSAALEGSAVPPALPAMARQSVSAPSDPPSEIPVGDVSAMRDGLPDGSTGDRAPLSDQTGQRASTEVLAEAGRPSTALAADGGAEAAHLANARLRRARGEFAEAAREPAPLPQGAIARRAASSASPSPARAMGKLEVMVQHAAYGLTWGKIFLDGQWINGQSPAWSGEVAVGWHELRVEAPCCLAEARRVLVAAGDQNPPVVFRLSSRPALLSVVSDEACEIWLDGLRRASCADSVRDPVAVPLPQGALRSDVSFLLVRPGKEDVVRTERFEAGQAREIRVSFAATE